MYLRINRNKKTGKTQLSIVHGYRDENGKSRQKTIKSLGYLHLLEKEYEDPISHFREVAKQMTKEYNEKTNSINLKLDPLEKLDINTDNSKNYGTVALSKIYHELGLDRFFSNRQRFIKIKYNLNNAVKLLVFSRILFPNSKKSTYELKHRFFDNTDFTLSNIYDSLTRLYNYKTELITWLYDKVEESYQRDNSVVFYDVTNYYFEIDVNDDDIYNEYGEVIEEGLRKKGVSKEHRPKPIVQMGLFMDKNYLPISYELFSGNTPDTSTLRPSIKKARLKYGLGRVVVVADKGLNSGDNIVYLKSGKNGYIFSKSVRNSTEEMKKYVLDKSGYREISKDYKLKSKLEPREIYYNTVSGRKNKQFVDEKILVVYSEKYKKKARHDREKTIKKAQDLVNNPSRYSQATTYGAAKYVDNLTYNTETGEIIDTKLSFNYEKLKEDELLDGYYIIVTSEMDWSDERILDAYNELWRIEETFKITKSYLDARPVHVWTKEHIEAHFMICFIGLLIVRLLEKKTNAEIPIQSMLESLKGSNYSLVEKNIHMLTYYDENLKIISEKMNIPFNNKYMTTGEIKRILGESKKAK
jgi:transposase